MTPTEGQTTTEAGVAATVQVLNVTQDQADDIDAAFRICSARTGRKVTGQFVSLFDNAVAAVLGFAPPDAYTLNVITTGAKTP